MIVEICLSASSTEEARFSPMEHVVMAALCEGDLKEPAEVVIPNCHIHKAPRNPLTDQSERQSFLELKNSNRYLAATSSA